MEQKRTAPANLIRLRFRRSAIAAAVLFAMPQPVARAASPATQDASSYFEQGAEAYAREKYDEASKAFAKSYALEPSTDVLFAWAQTERLAGNCEEAIRLYDRFLDTDPGEQQREAATQLKGECTAKAEPEPEPESEPELEGDAEPTQGPEPQEEAPTLPAQSGERDGGSSSKGESKAGLVLIGVGAGVGVVGLGLVGGGLGLDGRAKNAATYDDLEAYRDPSTGRGKGSTPLYVAGGVLAAAGVGVLVAGVLRHKRDRRPQARLPSVAPSFGSTFVGLSMSWHR